MATELGTLHKVCSKLDQLKIPYMLTGSFAASFYVLPRMTRDIDIVIELSNSGISSFESAFASGFYVDQLTIKEAIQQESLFNVLDEETGVKVDFIIRKKSDYRQIEFSRRIKVEMSGGEIWIVSPEDLILSKLFWAKDSRSELQLSDVKKLLELDALDKKYLERWANDLEVRDLLREME